MGNYRGSCIIIIITIIIIHGHLSVREADQTSLVALWPISELTQNRVNTCNDSIGFTKPQATSVGRQKLELSAGAQDVVALMNEVDASRAKKARRKRLTPNRPMNV